MAQNVAPLARDPQLEAIRQPPHSLEAEQAVLGGLLIDNAAWDRIADAVTEGDFYRQDHRLIFRAISKLINDSKPADVISVAEVLRIGGELESAGGIPCLGGLAQNTASSAN